MLLRFRMESEWLDGSEMKEWALAPVIDIHRAARARIVVARRKLLEGPK